MADRSRPAVAHDVDGVASPRPRPAYCTLSLDFLDGGYAPNGFDLEALRADLALVTA